MSKRLRIKVTPMTAEERAALREEDVFRGFTDPVLTLVCSYCGLVYGTKPCDPGREAESHGICRKCWPGAREDMGLEPAPYPGGEK